ncbi:MAG: Rpn family recombination-promoting nuclease/putative transposase [Cyanobacteriota bacterium]|nr:Rpn family recombination-promoting nuclease/putative transposase [Cyanobacteriota bacterium]
MKFISPKVDYAFKRIFGSDKSNDILISFLNAIIYNGKSIIKSLTIVDPYNPGQVEVLKDTYLDVRAVLYDGSKVVIEMQAASMKAFDKRVAYNLCKAYSNQLEVREAYWQLNPVIAVTITDFSMFEKSEKVVTKFIFREEEDGFKYKGEELRLIFVELPKFKKKLEELKSLTDKWIFFLKETATLEEIPPILGEVPEIERAFDFANQANLTVKELEDLQQRTMQFYDESGRIIQARIEGLKEGREEGLKEGRFEQAIALIMRQLKKRFGEISAEVSGVVEGLSLEDLEALTEDIFDFNSLEDLSNWLAAKNSDN